MAVELAGRAAPTPTILCIDDNRAGLAIRKLLLEHQGYSVLTAEDGVIGLSLLERHPVDAVVLDYRMPGMDGDAVAQIIRQRTSWSADCDTYRLSPKLGGIGGCCHH
jgi:CheY-like chemotaxis protein